MAQASQRRYAECGLWELSRVERGRPELSRRATIRCYKGLRGKARCKNA
jgi:hypothetical protein